MMTDTTTIGEIPEDFDFPDAVADGQYIQVTYESAYADDTQSVAGQIKRVAISEGHEIVGLAGWQSVEISFMPHDMPPDEWETPPRRLSATVKDGVVQWTVLEGRNGARWHRLNRAGDDPLFTILPL